jgi:hypothetical protein
MLAECTLLGPHQPTAINAFPELIVERLGRSPALQVLGRVALWRIRAAVAFLQESDDLLPGGRTLA